MPGLIALNVLVLLLASACGDEGGPATAKIAFVSDRDGNGEVYVMNDDGTGQTNLANNPADDAQPAWSPAP
jgi:hypothetical protein